MILQNCKYCGRELLIKVSWPNTCEDCAPLLSRLKRMPVEQVSALVQDAHPSETLRQERDGSVNYCAACREVTQVLHDRLYCRKCSWARTQIGAIPLKVIEFFCGWPKSEDSAATTRCTGHPDVLAALREARDRVVANTDLFLEHGAIEQYNLIFTAIARAAYPLRILAERAKSTT